MRKRGSDDEDSEYYDEEDDDQEVSIQTDTGKKGAAAVDTVTKQQVEMRLIVKQALVNVDEPNQ